MPKIIVLDSSPVGLLVTPETIPLAADCRVWLADLIAARTRIVVPEIVVYETRRELLRLEWDDSLEALEL